MAKEYDVIWSVRLAGDHPIDAIHHAQGIQQDPYSVCTGFRVVDTETEEEWFVDLEEVDDHEVDVDAHGEWWIFRGIEQECIGGTFKTDTDAWNHLLEKLNHD